MKRIRLLLGVMWIIGVLISMNLFSTTVVAEDVERKFTLSRETSDCMVQVYWDNKEVKATVTFVAPDGKVYDQSYDNFHSSEGLTWMMVDLAPAGEWSVTVTGDNLGEIHVEAGALPDYIEITKVDFTSISSSEFSVNWETSNATGSVRYEVFADRSPSGNSGVKVAEFSGEASGTQQFSLDRIDTGEYYFYLQATDSIGVPDILYADQSYKVVPSSVGGKLNHVTYGMINGSSYAKWDASDEYEEFRFMLFAGQDIAPIYEGTTEDNWFTYVMSEDVDPTVSYEIAVAGIKNGIVGDYDKYKVNTGVDLKYKVTYPDGDSVNYKSVLVPIEFDSRLTMSIFINDELFVERSSQTGDYTIDLLDGDNKISVVFYDPDGNITTADKELYVDTYPPQLQLIYDLNGRVLTQAGTVILGRTEAAAELMIDGKIVEVDSNGSFSYDYKLSPGKNTIEIKATDAAGNETVMLIDVTYNFFGSKLFYILLLSVITTVFLIYYVFIFFRIRRKARNDVEGGAPNDEITESGSGEDRDEDR